MRGSFYGDGVLGCGRVEMAWQSADLWRGGLLEVWFAKKNRIGGVLFLRLDEEIGMI